MTKTKVDPAAVARAVENEVMQLREWGTDRLFPLPPPRAGDWIIGSAVRNWLRLQDANHFISRKHAALRLVGETWSIDDLESTNGLWIDGRRVATAALQPGTEIGLGRQRLIVESPRTVRLGALLRRFLGWELEQRPRVDRGLRALREFDEGRAPLWLTGQDDLGAIARHIHREVVGDEHPIDITSLDKEPLGPEHALRDMGGGTLCLCTNEPTADILVVRALFEARIAPRMIVCSRAAGYVSAIDLPPLSSRIAEIERIVSEYAVDAIMRLPAKPASFATADRVRLLEDPPQTLAEIEVATRRLIAIREFGGVTNAALHLGIKHPALSRWFKRFMAKRRRHLSTTP